MKDERGEGRGPKRPRGIKGTKTGAPESADPGTIENDTLDAKDAMERAIEIESLKNLDQVEYLLFQSTRGLHFVFDHSEIKRALAAPTEDSKFYTDENMVKVQKLLSTFLEGSSFAEKRSFLERLPADEYELLVRSYFHLVDNAILENSSIRH